jgi:DNA repair protein RadC
MSKRYRLKLPTYTVLRECAPLPRIFRNDEDNAEFANTIVNATDDDKEHFWLVLLHPKHHYLMHHEVSMGSQIASIVHPRQVFGPALGEGAAEIVVFHNQPSGDPMPSAEDKELTRRLKEVGELVGIRLLDHVIVGNGTRRWVSLHQTGDIR